VEIAIAKRGRDPRFLSFLAYLVHSSCGIDFFFGGGGWTRKFTLPGFLTLLVETLNSYFKYELSSKQNYFSQNAAVPLFFNTYAGF
jgi:hypothetical protein